MANNQFRVLIVDTNLASREFLKSLLSELNNVEIIGEADSVEMALYRIVEHYPNLVFIDVDLPENAGMKLVRLLKSRNVDVPVVLVSANKEFAIHAIRNQIFDVLMKPVGSNDLNNVIEKFKRLNIKDLPGKLMEVLDSIKEERKIRINSQHSYILISPSEIVYCESEDGYTIVHLRSGKKEVANTSLTQIELKVEGQKFYRLGRSVLFNMDYLRSIDKGTDSVVLKYNANVWEVLASHKSIKELLQRIV